MIIPKYSLIITFFITHNVITSYTQAMIQNETNLEEKICLLNQKKNFSALDLKINDLDNTDEESPVHITIRKNFDEFSIFLLEHNQQFLYAKNNGHETLLLYLIMKSADPNALTLCGKTPLHYAAKYSLATPIMNLINYGAYINAQDNKGNSPLHKAIKNKNKTAITALLTLGANVNLKNNNRETPLHFAALQGNLKTIQMLTSSGANLNVKTIHNKTPYDYAYSKKHTRILDFFDHYALHHKNLNPTQPRIHIDPQTLSIYQSIHALHSNNYIINHCPTTQQQQPLIPRYELDAYMKTLDQSYFSPLHFAAQFGNKEAIYKIITEGSIVNYKSPIKKITPLHIATISQNLSTASELIACGADVNAQLDNGATPLHLATFNENYQILEILLAHGACTNTQGLDGKTPLHIAVEKQNELFIIALMKFGASPNILDKQGLSPLHYALLMENEKIINAINNTPVDIPQDPLPMPALHYAIKTNDINKIYQLVRQGADVNSHDRNNVTPLHHAVRNNNIPIVYFLLSHGANVNARSTRTQAGPLHYAAQFGFSKIIKILIQNGAYINALDSIT